MCGIAGWALNPADIPLINSRKLAKALLLGIEERGTDATGVAFRTPTGSSPIQIHKAPVPASLFVKRMPMPRSAQVGILHTRFATQGTPQDNNNNHPIYNSGIVGVHNGVISNDTQLFRESGAQRYGEVDSEAAFAAIAKGVLGWGTNANTRYTDLETILGEIRGSAALAWMDEEDDDDVLHLAKVQGSPLVLGYTENGSLLFASTMSTLKEAEAAIGLELKYYHAKDGEYFKVVAGEIVETIDFVPSYTYYRYNTALNGTTRVVTRTESQYNVTSIVRDATAPPTGRPVTDTLTATNPSPSELASVLSDDLPLVKEEATFEYYDHYSERENNIDVLAATAADIHVRARMLHQLHGYLRIGQWVETTFGNGVAYGQVYEMPQSFPHGQYIIRVLMESPERESGTEWVLVGRTCDEFHRRGEPVVASQEEQDEQELAEMAEEQAELDLLLDNRMANELTVFDVEGHWDDGDEFVMDGSVPALGPGSSLVDVDEEGVVRINV